jgi:hypothetical protein
LLFGNETKQFLVREVVVGVAGSLSIGMVGDLSLDILPNNSLKDEYWRFFKPISREAHIIVSGEGLRIGA